MVSVTSEGLTLRQAEGSVRALDGLKAKFQEVWGFELVRIHQNPPFPKMKAIWVESGEVPFLGTVPIPCFTQLPDALPRRRGYPVWEQNELQCHHSGGAKEEIS